MPSAYPAALDVLANPSGSDSMVTVDHAAQHAAANDAIEAVQAELGTNPSGAAATVAARIAAIETAAGAASETAAGIVELATTAEAAAGADTARAVTAAGVLAAIKANDSTTVACSDEATAITAGTAKITFRMVGARTLVGVRASLSTAQASGSIFTVDINKNGTTVLSTKLTIENTEKTSVTAATAVVISVTAFADNDEITIDVDQIGASGAKGLKVTLLWG